MEDLHAGLLPLAESVGARLHKHGLKCRGVQVTIKDPQFKSIDRQMQLSHLIILKGSDVCATFRSFSYLDGGAQTMLNNRKYIPFTDVQKLEANSVNLVEFLRSQGEELRHEGRDYKRLGHPGVTVRGNVWYDHYEEQGGYPVKFLQKYFDLDYVDAMTGLLGNSRMLTPTEPRQREKQEKKEFVLPQTGADMRHVYAYLMKRRFIDRDVIDHYDADEMLKAQNGVAALPAVKHHKVEAMRELCESLAAEQPDTTQPYKRLFSLCGRVPAQP